MSNILAAPVRNEANDASVDDVADVDPRVVHSKQALSHAVIALMHERDLSDVTVQQILDRAGVGRATFYAHFRNKEDVLHSSYDSAFGAFASMLDDAHGDHRLFPVREFVQHVGEQRAFVHALQRTARIDEAWTLFSAHAARAIARRLPQVPAASSSVPVTLVAHMLAGALVESVRWWVDHPGLATAGDVDSAFHAMARAAIRRTC